MCTLIAVDEAGYGPKLGPLCVAATAWQTDDRQVQSTSEAFEQIARPMTIQDVTVCVDDSKKVFSGGGSQIHRDENRDPLSRVARIIAVAERARGANLKHDAERINALAAADLPAIRDAPWLADVLRSEVTSHQHDFPPQALADAAATWALNPWRLIAVRVRVLTARRLNQIWLSDGLNKSDLLSQVSLRLAWDLWRDSHRPADETAEFYFDRHGGRRYYAGVLQHVWSDLSADGPALAGNDPPPVRIEQETQRCSRYRTSLGDREAVVQFTVKGDQFTPVALSSLHAKWMREMAMRAFNGYFHRRWLQSQPPDVPPPRPTAGYPQDAERFLQAISPLVRRDKILLDHLVRRR